MPSRFLLQTVTLLPEPGPSPPIGPKTYDMLDSANGLVPPGTIGQGSQLELVFTNTGTGAAYVGTPADVAADASGTVVTTNLVIGAGAVRVNMGPFDASAGIGRLLLRVFVDSVVSVTPLFTRR